MHKYRKEDYCFGKIDKRKMIDKETIMQFTRSHPCSKPLISNTKTAKYKQSLIIIN